MKLASVLFMLSIALSCALACGKFGHASCALTWTIQAPCTTVFSNLKANIQHCCAEKAIDTAYTNYTLVSADASAMILQAKLYFTDGYVDDQSIKLAPSGSTCVASVCSMSESLSIYDYCANYCDGHNLIRGLGMQFTEQIGSCSYVPNDQGKCPSFGTSKSDLQDPKNDYCNHQ